MRFEKNPARASPLREPHRASPWAVGAARTLSHAGVSERSRAQAVICEEMLCIWLGEEKKTALSAHVSRWNWLCRVCLMVHQEEEHHKLLGCYAHL